MKKVVMVLILVMFLAGCKESLLEKDKTKARDFSRAVHDSNYVKDSKAIHSSDYVEDSEAIYSSDHVYWGEAIYSSYYTQSCNGLSYSGYNYDVSGAYSSDGNWNSNGLYNCDFMINCNGCSNSIFCYEEDGILYKAFNQQGTEEQIKNLKKDIYNLLKYESGWDCYGERAYKTWFPKVLTYNHKTNSFEAMESKYKIDGYGSFEHRYWYAWNECPKKEKLIGLIKETEWLDTELALGTFFEITGILKNGKSVLENREGMVLVGDKLISEETLKRAIQEYVK